MPATKPGRTKRLTGVETAENGLNMHNLRISPIGGGDKKVAVIVTAYSTAVAARSWQSVSAGIVGCAAVARAYSLELAHRKMRPAADLSPSTARGMVPERGLPVFGRTSPMNMLPLRRTARGRRLPSYRQQPATLVFTRTRRTFSVGAPRMPRSFRDSRSVVRSVHLVAERPDGRWSSCAGGGTVAHRR